MKQPRTVRVVARRDSKPIVATLLSQAGTATTSHQPGFDQINPKWTWHYRALLKWRDRLRTERQARLNAAAQPLEPHSMDPADSASDAFDHDVALALLSTEQEALNEIDAALERIRRGTYGVCELTGEPISAARLHAIPWTRFARAAEASAAGPDQSRAPHLGHLGTVRPLRSPARPTDAVTLEADPHHMRPPGKPAPRSGPEPTADFPFDDLTPET